MRILADENVPEEYVAALRGDDHRVTFTRNIDALGREANDDTIVEYAESERWALITTDVKDFANRDTAIPVFVATQNMSGGAVRAAIARIETLPLDPAETDPLWLSSV